MSVRPRLDAAQRALVRGVDGMAERAATHVLRRYGSAVEFRELVAVGHLAIAEAAASYDPDHPAASPFTVWAFYRASEAMMKFGARQQRDSRTRNALRASLRFAGVERRSEPRDPFRETTESIIGELRDLAGGVAAAYIDAFHGAHSVDGETQAIFEEDSARGRQAVQESIAELSPDDREILRLRFIEDRDLRHVAALKGTSYWVLYRRQQAVLKLLRAKLRRRGVEVPP